MNIFARELASILGKRGKKLASLYGLRSDTLLISPHKVSRLIQSLDKKDITATLNPDELDVLTEWLGLEPDGEEVRRLRAALVAEGVHLLLSGRLDRDEALGLAELAFLILLGQAPEHYEVLRQGLLKRVRGDVLPAQVLVGTHSGTAASDAAEGNSTSAQVEQALEIPIQVYEQGAFWFALAHVTSATDLQLGYLSQSQTLLKRAQDLASNVPAAQGTPQLGEWLAIMERTLAQAEALAAKVSKAQ